MNTTTNYGFPKPSLTDNALITVISDSFESIDTTIKSVENKNLVQTAGGTATSITLTLPSSMDNGYKVTFVASANNGGSATTINNTYSLYKPGTTTAPILVSEKAYDIWYNSSSNCFFLKANASGNAVASDVLASKTFSTDIDTDIIGTIPSKSGQTYAPSTASRTISAGQYLSGVQIISPVTGNTNVSQVLSGYVFSSANGINLTGNIPSKSSQTYSPSTSTQTISSGQYLSGIQTIAPVTGTATTDKVVNGYTFSSGNGVNLIGTATITSLGGYKKVYYPGSPNPVVPVATENFVLAGGGNYSSYVVDITGFDFTPEIAIFYTAQLGWVIYNSQQVQWMNGGRVFNMSDNPNIIVSYGRLRIPEPQHGACVIYGN